ncbi:uncharacterized protein METZ01_LOCUS215094 [marine metagenome]|uniref:Uncharacterized protein n=1 Tax=marine metagenome TaxID=408172 RepID=A0A382FGZ2_9ZZZZ
MAAASMQTWNRSADDLSVLPVTIMVKVLDALEGREDPFLQVGRCRLRQPDMKVDPASGRLAGQV